MASHNKALCLLLISLLLLTTWAHDTDKCGHDQIEHGYDTIDVEESGYSADSGRLLTSSSDTTYSNIRIYPYFGFVPQNANSTYTSYIENDLVPPVIAYYEAALRIKYPVSGNLKLGSSVTSLCGHSVPSILTTTGVAADFFMFYDTYASDQFTAYAGSCYLASGTKRPIIARTMINRNRFYLPQGDVLIHESNMYTIIHETTHALGFDNNLFNYFLDSNGNKLTGQVKSVSIAGETRTVVDIAPLTQKLRDFYGCSSLPGAIMENDGGSGTANSHFETKYFVYELMVSSSNFGRRVSEFTLSFLEGTGWYAPNYDYAEPFAMGQGQGCSFINQVCSSTGTNSFDQFEEYCTGSSRGCAPIGRGGGPCTTSSLMEGCSTWRPYNEYDCDNDNGADFTRMADLQVYGRGLGSKCFTGTLNTRQSTSGNTNFCFKYTCSGTGLGTVLKIQVGSNTVTCTQAGTQTINGYYGVVDCPDPLSFCEGPGKQYCPLNCAGRGTCVNNKCQCNSGFTGVDCALRV